MGGMQLDAIGTSLLYATGCCNEMRFDIPDFFFRQGSGRPLLLERPRDDIRQVIIVDGTRAGMIDLHNKAHIVFMRFCNGTAKLRDEAVIVDIDLLRIGTAACIDTTMPRVIVPMWFSASVSYILYSASVI